VQEALELEQMEGGNQGGIGLPHKKRCILSSIIPTHPKTFYMCFKLVFTWKWNENIEAMRYKAGSYHKSSRRGSALISMKFTL